MTRVGSQRHSKKKKVLVHPVSESPLRPGRSQAISFRERDLRCTSAYQTSNKLPCNYRPVRMSLHISLSARLFTNLISFHEFVLIEGCLNKNKAFRYLSVLRLKTAQ